MVGIGGMEGVEAGVGAEVLVHIGIITIGEKDITMMTIVIVGAHMIMMIVMIDLIGILPREIGIVGIKAFRQGRGTEVLLEEVVRNGGPRSSSGIENVIKGIFPQKMVTMQMKVSGSLYMLSQ